MFTLTPVRLACACLASVLAVPAFAQNATAKPAKPEPDTATTRKRTVVDEAAAITAATVTPTTGTFVAKFTIKLATAVPSGSEVLCALNTSVVEDNTTTYTVNNEIYDTKTAKATVSGSTATCSISLPYSWYLSTPSSDTASLTYYLYIINSTATNQAGETRTSSQFVPGAGAIKIPANGSTTTYTISATI